MKRHILSAILILAAATSQATTLIIKITGYNSAKGDNLEYRLPGGAWITLYPAYDTSIVYGVPANLIVVARVRRSVNGVNTQVSLQAKSTGRNPADADANGNVRFYMSGSG